MYVLGKGNSRATLDCRCLPIAIFTKTLHTLHYIHFTTKNNNLQNVIPYIDPTQLYIDRDGANEILCFTRHYMNDTIVG